METKKHNDLLDFMRWLSAQAEIDLRDGYIHKIYDRIRNHVRETAKIFLICALLVVVLFFGYTVVASVEYNFVSNGGAPSPLYWAFFAFFLLGFLVVAAIFTLVALRVGVYSVGFPLAKSVGLSSVNFIYTIASAVVPDLIEDFLGTEKIEKLIAEAKASQDLEKIAAQASSKYAKIPAWTLAISFLFVVFMPLSFYANPTTVLACLLGVVTMLWMVYGWDSGIFWRYVIESALFYIVGGYLAFHIVLRPTLSYAGLWDDVIDSAFFPFAIAAIVIGGLLFIIWNTSRRYNRGYRDAVLVTSPSVATATVASGLGGVVKWALILGVVIILFTSLIGGVGYVISLAANAMSNTSSDFQPPSRTATVSNASRPPKNVPTKRNADSGPSMADKAIARLKSVKAGDRFTFQVSAKSFLDTGLDITNHQVRIQVTGGEWKNHPNSGLNDGAGRGTQADQANLIYTGAPLSSLIGNTDSGYFLVGNDYEGSPGAGRLRLGINDKEGTYQDNVGTLSVTIEILS